MASTVRDVDTISELLDYVVKLLSDLNSITAISSKSKDADAQEFNSIGQLDWVDDGPSFCLGEDDNEESSVDESDDESLCNKLCTFAVTQREFMQQHWYHCHTCNMTDKAGVCSICSKVCHKDHDVTYAKYGAFFCDCAGRENSTCMALVKRAPEAHNDELDHKISCQDENSDLRTANARDRPSRDSCCNDDLQAAGVDTRRALIAIRQSAEYLEPQKDKITAILSQSNLDEVVLRLLDSLIPAFYRFAHDESHLGRSHRAREALDNLHTMDKTFVMTESLMQPTLGSQEGALENVRVNYVGEHASMIKQLINSCTLRRIAMTSLASPLGKRQHLVVCHEKGKLTLLQLNAFLRQADSSKRKLTLTRLAYAPVPFSVISIIANPFNEDVLAVCGLKDCHVLRFNTYGLISSHIEVQLDLSGASNYIIKAVWLPGSQTELAVLTSEMVKIFDLSESPSEPKYYFKLASGQLKDITFIVPESKSTIYILLMDTAGHIYTQELEHNASTIYGLFYVTTELNVPFADLKEQGANNKTPEGGVSLYYSHSFKMLFMSFANGNYMASMSTPTEIRKVFLMDLELSGSVAPRSHAQSTYATVAASASIETDSPEEQEESSQETVSKTTSKSPDSSFQPLCQWSEISGHVGMLMAVCLYSNNPVIIMLRENHVSAQEIRSLTIKSRITDATAIRHTTSSGEVRTTLILLCEDGSLRIYMASQESTDYWLKLSMNTCFTAGPNSLVAKSCRKKRLSYKSMKRIARSSSNPTFPVDFFENLQQLNDVEYGGTDLLSIYNVQQLKTRINNPSMQITCNKQTNFSLEITNNQANMVICGLRVFVGSKHITRAPISIGVFNRVININPATPRWYDIPLTREESLQAKKHIVVTFGPSLDPDNITNIDTIKVYGKTKENFAWPDDRDEQVTQSIAPGEDYFAMFMDQEAGNRYQRLMVKALEALELMLNIESCKKKIDQNKLDELSRTLFVTSFSVPYSQTVIRSIKNLLVTYYSSRQCYSQLRDAAAMNFVMSNLTSFDQDTINGELFSKVVYIMKSLCVAKSSNLSVLGECVSAFLVSKDSALAASLKSPSAKLERLILYIHDVFWRLHSQRPANPVLASIASNSYMNYEDILQPLIELICLATLYDLSTISVATEVLIGLLLSNTNRISSCTRHTLIKLLKFKYPQEEPHVQSPGESAVAAAAQDASNRPAEQSTSNRMQASVSYSRPATESSSRSEAAAEQPSSLVDSQQSSLISQLRNVIGVQIENLRAQDADEDIDWNAIALSLQDDSQNNSVTDNAATAAPTISGRSELNFLSDRMPSAEELMSDTTASGVASDDDVPASTQSIAHTTATSQRSASASQPDAALPRDDKEAPVVESDKIASSSASAKPILHDRERLRQQHLMLLESLIEHLPATRDVGGFRSIALLDVILVLTSDLECENEVDDAILKNLLHALKQELLWKIDQPRQITHRSATNEVKVVIMRMFSIMMSKLRTSNALSSRQDADNWAAICSSTTASYLIESNVIDFCYSVLEELIEYWRSSDPAAGRNNGAGSAVVDEVLMTVNKRTLPKLAPNSQMPDLAPFFTRQYGRSYGSNLFDDYSQLLFEMLLRIPYQIKKVSHSSNNTLKPVEFSSQWLSMLCEYLMIPIPSNIRKHVRKLLTFLCGSKDRYRQLRDFHFLNSHMHNVQMTCGYPIDNNNKSTDEIDDDEINKTATLSYETLTALVDHLKSCIDIAQSRCINWQLYCLTKDQKLLAYLMKMSLRFGEEVSQIVLDLLQYALNTPTLNAPGNMGNLLDDPPVISTSLPGCMANQALETTIASESLSAQLAQQLLTSITTDVLSRFVKTFLLETNMTAIRWQAHSLLYSLWLNFNQEQRLSMVRVLWSLWNSVPKYGRKAAQYVDLLGFITLKICPYDNELDEMFCSELVTVLRQQNELLTNHPNAHIYSSIQGLVDLDSYYLESEPCTVCNSPEIPYSNVKLSAIKVDSRFTTTTQIIKLLGSHTILKFFMRISDIKRSKMVKTISIYYNNRSVQSVVELKNKTCVWNLARKYTLTPGQNDVKIEFTLPIVACNVMLEFSDFYENFQATSETLQCPRCSTSVSANPGVCSNCGENVFQCHKCRAINYDEKDPFLCTSCGFCKYARFDTSLTAKPTCAVDPIENEDDRKKTVVSICNLMEKADRVYKNIIQNKPTLELLLLRIHDQIVPDYRLFDDGNGPEQSIGPMKPHAHGSDLSLNANHAMGYTQLNSSVPATYPSNVNKAIQHLAQKYCVECKNLFEELSKISHRVLASRRELVEYDNRQLRRCLNAGSIVLSSANRRKSRVYSSLSSGSGTCYGCASATVDHCVTLLKALATITQLKRHISNTGIIADLLNYNLRTGSNFICSEVRQLLSTLTQDDFESTAILNNLLLGKITSISEHNSQHIEIYHIVRHEFALLALTLSNDDQCWEQRVRCLIRVFILASKIKNPLVMETLMIPCLSLILSIARPPSPTTRRNKDRSVDNIASVRSDSFRSRVLLQDWLESNIDVFVEWRKRASRPNTSVKSAAIGSARHVSSSSNRRASKAQLKCNYLAEKYGNRWRLRCSKFNKLSRPISSLPNDWLKRLLFNQSSRTIRLMAKSLVESLLAVQSRRREVVDLLSSYLDEVGVAGESAQEFYNLYKNVILTEHWRYYLSLQGVLIKIACLMMIEIEKLQELEETTLNSSMSLGYSLRMLVELLTFFINVDTIRSCYKSKLVGFVLKGYLSLRKLVVQRTKVIDETQEMLLDMLEGMTTGNESETAAFLEVCVEAIKNCHEGDIRTPVFIFERICSTIHPEENLHSEFLVSLEKDPQQEDYLQGRMLGNPYSSNEPGIGPLMKDIKNKICQDCELLALLEDDSSMELLVANKIISLDLSVRDVYKKIWCPENHEGDAMRIVYRMRGLLGDATEEFIESLDSRAAEQVDEEQEFKMANFMSSTGGLDILIKRLNHIDDHSPPFKPLLDVILKLFNHCTKTKANRLKLLSPELETINVLLKTLKLALNEEDFAELAGLQPGAIGKFDTAHFISANKQATQSTPNPRAQVVDQVLTIIETIMREASKQAKNVFQKICNDTCGTVEDVQFLLDAALMLSTRITHVSHNIIQVVPFLTLGNRDKMVTLLSYFKPHIDLKKFDIEHSSLNDTAIDLFCIMVDAIEQNDVGNQLKNFIVAENIVSDSLDYLTTNAPPLKSSLLATSEEWKSFTSKPALKYVLRILRGLAQSHSTTQLLISRDCIPIIHGLEQVSSDARVGSLAENLLEAIREHPSVAEKIMLVRKQTREEKKRLAMAVRERQLGALGMRANERGQVTAKSKLLEQCKDLAEDTGLICNICREGYEFQPSKVLGIYTYTKRCVLDEYEMKPRKTYGYTSVTHFNTVHIECHMSAVRSARGRDEWDSAALQNANTRCNGLLPIWGPQVPESVYANALARHDSYLQDCLGNRDISYQSTVHDIRLQLLRFAQERSFSEDTGGGGPQSNLHLIPYMIQKALYMLNSTKSATREYKRVFNYLEMSSDEILENCYEADSPYYWITMAMLVLPPNWWKRKRVQFLRRLIICNNVRRASIKPPAPISDTRVRGFSYYKSALIFAAFIDSLFNIVFKDAQGDDKWNHEWSAKLADYIRQNDQTVNDNIEVLLNLYQNSLLQCNSIERFFEIVPMDEVSAPGDFISAALQSA